MTTPTEKDRERAADPTDMDRDKALGWITRHSDSRCVPDCAYDLAILLAAAREEGRREGAEAADSRARQAEAEVARLLVAARDVLSGRPGCIFVLAQAVADTKGQP